MSFSAAEQVCRCRAKVAVDSDERRRCSGRICNFCTHNFRVQGVQNTV